MATWGSRSKSGSSRAKGTSRSSAPLNVSSRTLPTKSSKSADNTAPVRRGDRARAELRDAVGDRQHEFIGIAFIVGGLLTALAVYATKIAGVLGRALNYVAAWLAGLGRFGLPIALIGVGVALVRRGRSAHRTRLILSLIHI